MEINRQSNRTMSETSRKRVTNEKENHALVSTFRQNMKQYPKKHETVEFI